MMLDTLKYIVDKAANVAKSLEEYCDPDAIVLDMDRSLQLDRYSCGVQSAYMILRYYGKARSISNVEKLLGTDEDGTTESSILRLFRQRGLSVLVRPHARMKDIYHAIDEYGGPMLTYLKDNDHWSVVYGYSPDKIYVLDPSLYSARLCGWDKSYFKSRWGRWGAIAYRK